MENDIWCCDLYGLKEVSLRRKFMVKRPSDTHVVDADIEWLVMCPQPQKLCKRSAE